MQFVSSAFQSNFPAKFYALQKLCTLLWIRTADGIYFEIKNYDETLNANLVYTQTLFKVFMSQSFKSVMLTESKPQFSVANVFCNHIFRMFWIIAIKFRRHCSHSQAILFQLSKVGKANSTRFLLFVRFTVKNQQI